ncbi:hypothetical protein KY308_00405 [Candidatus Woesearchaeota archaeon]|nr:hypothetical protein [Candidatus Woesearchaeota archaeon]
MIFSRSSKKAQVEVQFNWIFVLIVGAFILVFFIAIVNVQRNAADKNLAFDILGKIDLILNGALTIPKTGQIFDVPKIDFRFDCDRISALGVDRQFQDRVVFGPDLLKGRQMIVWSQDWTVPYKAANFLYVTSDNIRYIIYDKSGQDYAQRFSDELPDNLSKDIVSAEDFSEFTNKNNYKIRVIFLGEDIGYGSAAYNYITGADVTLPDFTQGMPDSSVTAVYVSDSEVRFFEKTGNKFDPFKAGPVFIQIIGAPMGYGAVFSENRQMFNCSYAKAFEKLFYVSKVYGVREHDINTSYSDPSSPYYNEDCIAAPRAEDVIENIANSAKAGIIPSDSDISAVRGRNEQALEKSCAAIY